MKSIRCRHLLDGEGSSSIIGRVDLG